MFYKIREHLLGKIHPQSLVLFSVTELPFWTLQGSPKHGALTDGRELFMDVNKTVLVVSNVTVRE